MIPKKDLTQFYISEYEAAMKQKKKNMSAGKNSEERMERLLRSLKTARAARLNTVMLEDYHKQMKNIAIYAYRHHREDQLALLRTELIPKLVQLDLDFMMPQQREGMDAGFLTYLQENMRGKICTTPLFYLYPQYRKQQIENQIVELVPTRPELEFPDALDMQRHFILHIGPTNSGKTFQALERLKKARNGVYLGPLRLLALEVYEKMKEAQVPCTMLTGQECISEENSRIISSTVEMADLEEFYDIAVIDEAQMMEDADRGHSWTRAILGLKAPEIHVCSSEAAEHVLRHLITLCGDTFEIRRYERKTALVCEQKPFVFPDDIREGDALIAFSKKSVLDVAGRLEEQGIASSIIYGSLPPEIRRRQMHLFTGKKTKVVVSTDAIGMGLNLPVRRIVFLQVEKFDGVSRRPLRVSEIRQIGGRAGRFGIYDTGYINAMGEEELDYIKRLLQQPERPIERVNLGFPQVLLDIQEPLDEILKVWHSVEPSQPFEKENVDEALYLYGIAKQEEQKIDGFSDKRILYRMITCPIDIKDRKVVELWLQYCKTYSADVSLPRPVLAPGTRGGILKYETYYKQLDLYYQFSHRMGKIIEEEWLKEEREKTEAKIMRFLAKGKENYIARCPYCARPLPIAYPYRVCENCYSDRPSFTKADFF